MQICELRHRFGENYTLQYGSSREIVMHLYASILHRHFIPFDRTFSWHYKMFWIHAFASERQTMFELDSSIRFQLCRIRVHPDFINKDIRYKIINDVFISSEVFAVHDFVL